MGEAGEKKQAREQAAWPYGDNFRGRIDLHMLSPAATIEFGGQLT